MRTHTRSMVVAVLECVCGGHMVLAGRVWAHSMWLFSQLSKISHTHTHPPKAELFFYKRVIRLLSPWRFLSEFCCEWSDEGLHISWQTKMTGPLPKKASNRPGLNLKVTVKCGWKTFDNLPRSLFFFPFHTFKHNNSTSGRYVCLSHFIHFHDHLSSFFVFFFIPETPRRFSRIIDWVLDRGINELLAAQLRPGRDTPP